MICIHKHTDSLLEKEICLLATTQAMEIKVCQMLTSQLAIGSADWFL